MQLKVSVGDILKLNMTKIFGESPVSNQQIKGYNGTKEKIVAIGFS